MVIITIIVFYFFRCIPHTYLLDINVCVCTSSIRFEIIILVIKRFIFIWGGSGGGTFISSPSPPEIINNSYLWFQLK